MRFENPYPIYLALLIFILFLFHLLAYQKRKKRLEILAQKELLRDLISPSEMKRERVRSFLIFLAVIFCGVALMRPQWGFRWEEGKRSGLDILLAIDTSKSMLAEDVQPNRMKFAKGAVKDFIRQLKGDRIGLIAFSGSAFLICPLTTDYNGFILSLDSLDIDTVSKGGTSISSAIQEALRVFRKGSAKNKALVLLTDGEDHGGDPMVLANMAEEEGLKIFCLGIGTDEGELIPIIDQKGEKDFLKDRQGRVVKTHLGETLLEKISSLTGGGYARVRDGDSGLKRIYAERLSKMEKGEFEGPMRKHYREWFQIPLAIALTLLIVEHLIGRRRKKNEKVSS